MRSRMLLLAKKKKLRGNGEHGTDLRALPGHKGGAGVVRLHHVGQARIVRLRQLEPRAAQRVRVGECQDVPLHPGHGVSKHFDSLGHALLQRGHTVQRVGRLVVVP